MGVDLTSSRLHSESHVYPTQFQSLAEDSPETITHFRSVVPLTAFSKIVQSLISKFHRGLAFYDEAVTQRVMTAWLSADRTDTPEFIVRINPYRKTSLVLIDYSIDGVRRSSWHLVKGTTTDIAIRRLEDGQWVVKRFEASKNREVGTMDSNCARDASGCDMKAADEASRIRVIIVPLNSPPTPHLYSSNTSFYGASSDDDDEVPVYRSAGASQPTVYTAKMKTGSTHEHGESYDAMYEFLSTCTRADSPITVTDCFYVVQSDMGRINETAVTNRVSLMMDFFKSKAQQVASIHEQMSNLLTR